MKRFLLLFSVLIASLCMSISASAADVLTSKQIAAMVGYYEGTLDLGDGDFATAKVSITSEGYVAVQLISDDKTSSAYVNLNTDYDDFGIEQGYLYWYFEKPFEFNLIFDQKEVNTNTVQSCTMYGIRALKKSNEPQEIVDPDDGDDDDGDDPDDGDAELTPEQIAAMVGYYEGTLDLGDGDFATAKVSITSEGYATVQLISDDKTSSAYVNLNTDYDDFGIEQGYLYWYFEKPFEFNLIFDQKEVNTNTVQSCTMYGIRAFKKSNEPQEIVDPDDGDDDDGDDPDDGDDDDEGDEGDDNDGEDTPMEPTTTDITQYSHKVMVESYPRGNGVLNFVILRDDTGRVVQKMSMSTRSGGLEAVLTDSIRTYTYEDNKMIEDLSLPYYDENDQLHLEPMSRRVTSYHKLTNGRKEIYEEMRIEGDEYRTINRAITVYDEQERKVSYKYVTIYGETEEVLSDMTYSYADGGVYTKGYSNYDGYLDRFDEYDANGNLIKSMDYRNDNTLTKYFFDSRNHNLGYATYKNYNPETGTCSRENEYALYKVDEYYDDGGAKKAHTSGGYTKEYVRDGNTEIETLTKGYDTYRYKRTYDNNGALIKKEQLSSSSDFVIRSYDYTFSDIKAERVLGALTTIDEDYRFGVDAGTKWNYEYPIIASSFFWSEYNRHENNFYTIVPLSILPAQSTSEGVAISLGYDGDNVVLSSDGEIYLLDKGGKKRYSVSVGGITVSSEGGKLMVTGWTPISPSASAKGMRMTSESIDLTTNEYDIYIPENTITINGKPLNEVYVPISLDDATTGIIEVKNDIKASAADGRVYNLQGMQVNNPTHGQIVILNGKKVIIK